MNVGYIGLAVMLIAVGGIVWVCVRDGDANRFKNRWDAFVARLRRK